MSNPSLRLSEVLTETYYLQNIHCYPTVKLNLCSASVQKGELTKAHWDKSQLGQKPTGQYPTGQKPTAKFGRVDKSPLF